MPVSLDNLYYKAPLASVILTRSSCQGQHIQAARLKHIPFLLRQFEQQMSATPTLHLVAYGRPG